MFEVIDEIAGWLAAGQPVALATVLSAWGSAPRKPGAKMAVGADGGIAGSVSGGCVEGAVIDVALETLATGKAQVLHFGVADETAWGVGLACGGAIDVFVERLHLPSFEWARELRRAGGSGAIVTVVRGSGDSIGRKLFVDLPRSGGLEATTETDKRMLAVAKAVSESQVVAFDPETDVFVDLLRPSPTLIAVGGADISIALTRIASVLDFHTVVIDPRRAFGSDARFPHVDRLIQAWPRAAFAECSPTADTAVALLSHDPKIDDPALEILLHSDAFYIGALGSRKTHTRRLERLANIGFSEQQMTRIFAPIGLDIGAANPQEIALAIMAEIVAVQHGRRQPGM